MESLVEDAARLARGHHRRVELVEDPWVLGERVGERDAGLDIAPDVDERLLELLALYLFLEHVERAQERHPGADHRRELARSHGQVSGLDLFESGEGVAGAGGLQLLDVDDEVG
ncbi:MAG: hypothetical protein M3Q43_07235 [Actinomycetota bacterium]|nr:hypothetical protein [Actinomycetota bacterium]